MWLSCITGIGLDDPYPYPPVSQLARNLGLAVGDDEDFLDPGEGLVDKARESLVSADITHFFSGGSDSDVKRLLRRAVLYELFDQIGQAPWYERVL